MSGLVLALDAGNTKSYPATSAQLITNGTFDSNVTGWTISNSTNTWSSGKMQISRSGGDGRVSYQTFTTITGQTYRVTAEVNSSGSRGDVYIYDGSGIGGTRFLDITGTNGQTLTLTGTFTAISTITTLGFGVDANGTSIVVDNVSVSPLWTDLSGRGNNGTLTNGPTYSSANGGSLVFDGVDDYIDFPTTLSNQFSSKSITVFTFAKISSVVSKNTLLSFNGAFNFFLPGSRLGPTQQLYWDSTTSWKGGTTTSWTTNQWYQLAWTIDSSRNILFYINGILDYSSTISVDFSPTNNTAVRIGFANAGEYATGNISNTQIYNRALSAAEILQNFNALRGRYGI